MGTRTQGCIHSKLKVYFWRFTLNSCTLPPHTWYDQLVKPRAQKPPPRVIKAVSLLMHSPLLSIHFYHAQSYFLVHFHSTHFSAVHSSHSWPSSQPHTSQIDPTILFINQSSILSLSKPPHILCSAPSTNSFITPVLLCSSSFLQIYSRINTAQ